jgi:hypothetical protein
MRARPEEGILILEEGLGRSTWIASPDVRTTILGDERFVDQF